MCGCALSTAENADLLESYRAELKTCADEMHAVEKKMQDICLRIRSQT